MPDVILACCRAEEDGDPAVHYPDPDSELLRDALRASHVDAELRCWDDPAVDWSAAALVVVRSTWDSVDRPAEYLAWTARVDALTTLLNPHEALAWNLHKSYLDDLRAAGIAVVPTTWLATDADVDGWAPPADEFIVKPAVSAGGRETARYLGGAHDAAAQTHVQRIVAAGGTAMVQPYLPAVADPGEVSLVFLGGAFSHAVRKGPMFELGADVLDRPWEHMVYLGLTEPAPAEVAAAEAVMAQIAGRFTTPLLYGRVDLIDGAAGEPLVIEVELIDPYLSLDRHPPAAAALAAAIVERLGAPPLLSATK